MTNHSKTQKLTQQYIYTNPTKSVALHGKKKSSILLIDKSTFIIGKYLNKVKKYFKQMHLYVPSLL
jgi:hypothetical protein